MFADFSPHAILLVVIGAGAAAMVAGALIISLQRQATLKERIFSCAPKTGGEVMAAGDGKANVIDIPSEIRTILSRLLPEARRQFVQVTTAIQPDLVAASEPAAFRQALTDLFDAALRRAPCGRIIVTAGCQGAWVVITVSDDGMVAGLHATESVLRGASQLIAMQGGALEIDMRPGEGTITTIRLFAPAPVMAPIPGEGPAVTVMNSVPAAV